MRRLYHDVTGVGAVGRRRLQSVNPVTALKRRHPRSHGRDGARKIIAENQRKLGRAEQGQQPPAIAFAASHIDWVDRRRFDRDLDLVWRGLLPGDLPDFEGALAGWPEADQCSAGRHVAPFTAAIRGSVWLRPTCRCNSVTPKVLQIVNAARGWTVPDFEKTLEQFARIWLASLGLVEREYHHFRQPPASRQHRESSPVNLALRPRLAMPRIAVVKKQRKGKPDD